MTQERDRILSMLADGTITAEQAALLLDSLGTSPAAAPAGPSPTADWPTGPSKDGTPRYLFVKVTGNDQVDVKVPLALMRAGLKLTSVIPPQAMEQINESMGSKGVAIDFNNLKPEDIDEVIANLGDMEVNVVSSTGDNVRVYCA